MSSPDTLLQLPAEMTAASSAAIAPHLSEPSWPPVPVSMSSPDLTQAEYRAISQVLQTSTLSLGPQLEDFERALAAFIGASHGVGVSSGTSGLHLSMIASGVDAADLVVTTPFSFIASANCVLYERAIPIFVDVDPITGNIDPQRIAEAVWDLGRKPSDAEYWLPPALKGQSPLERGQLRAILPVHAFGQPADMDPIVEIAKGFNLPVIEDACEAIGSEYKGRKAGSLGDAAVFAFYPNKQVTTGEGGMIVTDKKEWVQLFRSLRNQGRDVFDSWLCHTRLGYNYRLDELSAALGLAQMRRIDDLLANRARVASWYDEQLAELELVQRPQIVSTTTRHSWFVYVVRILPPADRNDVMSRLAEAGIPCRPYFTPIHLQPFYSKQFGYQRGDFPITEYLGDVSLALPFSGVLQASEVDRVCTALRAALQH